MWGGNHVENLKMFELQNIVDKEKTPQFSHMNCVLISYLTGTAKEIHQTNMSTN